MDDPPTFSRFCAAVYRLWSDNATTAPTALNGSFGIDTAITHALRHSNIWSAAACHSGDMGFELCYLPNNAGGPARPRRVRKLSVPAGSGRHRSEGLKTSQAFQRFRPSGAPTHLHAKPDVIEEPVSDPSQSAKVRKPRVLPILPPALIRQQTVDAPATPEPARAPRRSLDCLDRRSGKIYWHSEFGESDGECAAAGRPYRHRGARRLSDRVVR
jgi:hypothetical protein